MPNTNLLKIRLATSATAKFVKRRQNSSIYVHIINILVDGMKTSHSSSDEWFCEERSPHMQSFCRFWARNGHFRLREAGTRSDELGQNVPDQEKQIHIQEDG